MLAVVVVGTTAVDRVLLGVHYPSDVTVGVLTGVGLALASYAGYVGWNPPHPTEAEDPDLHQHGEAATTVATATATPPPPGDLMPFLTRWDEDQSRPAFTSALRDLAVRAVLPAFGVFAVVVAFGFMLKGPLDAFSDWENTPSRWFEDGRTATGETITLYMSSIGNTEYVIGVCLLVVGDPLVAHEAVVVRRRPRHRDLAPGHDLRRGGAGRRPGPARRRAARPHPAHVELSSGHVGAATALYTTFAFMAATRIENVVLRRVVVALCVVRAAQRRLRPPLPWGPPHQRHRVRAPQRGAVRAPRVELPEPRARGRCG